MKCLNCSFYVEVMDEVYWIQTTENIMLRLEEQPKSLRKHYQVQNDAQLRKNNKVVGKNGNLGVEKYPKNKKKQLFNKQKLIFFPILFI